MLKRNRNNDTKQQTALENQRPSKRRRSSMSLIKYITICLIFGALMYRIVFDWDMYFHGAILEMRRESQSGYDYFVRIPPGYHAFSGKRPLLIYLHGAGETGKDIAELKKRDPFFWSREYVNTADYPFITVTPVTEIHGWNPDRLKRLVMELISNRDRFAIDDQRIYLTGFSMGGFGTFEAAEKYPDLFAAIAPVAGGGDVDQAERLKTMPVWAFHGDADSAVPYRCSKEMIEAIQKSGNKNARLTTFPKSGHGIVVDVYRNPELYQWFLQHRREK